MFAHVTNLRYWKSERANLDTCEDASRADTRRGLFCVSDGAGTTLFSNIWAEILVKRFMSVPLTSLDAFEMDWWIRQAQVDYRKQIPQADNLNWNARQKAVEQGAYATLATLRFLSSAEQSARAELLAIGDSCIIIGHAAQQTITAFPLQHPADFDRAPYCVPALLKNLNRKTLYAKKQEVELEPGDIIILATDAVARWIISGGATGEESSVWNAFQEVARIETEHRWQELIDSCRSNQSMVDDDATAVIVRLLSSAQAQALGEAAGLPEDGESASDGALLPEIVALGSAAGPLPEVVARRKAEFEQALAENNRELIAVLYGDGQMLQQTDLALPSTVEIAHARTVADAMREVLQAMREAIKVPNFAAKIEPIWRQYAALLLDEPCAASMRKTLASQGVTLRPAPASPVSPISAPAPSAAQAPLPSFAPGPGNPSLPQLTNHEPEPARVISPAPNPPELARLQQALAAGAPQEKVAAWQSAHQNQPQFQLNASDQLQLDLAQRLLEALQTDNSAEICAVYDEIEKLALLRYFAFTPEELQRVREAQSTRASIEQLRAVLHNDGKSVSLLVNVYQTIRAPQSFLTHAEQSILETAQAFTRLSANQELTTRLDDPSRVYLYDELLFSPHHFTFDMQERLLLERVRARGKLGYPPLAQVNQTIIDSAHFFAFYIVLPYFARVQIRQLVEMRAKERSEALIYQHNQHIAYWQHYLTEPSKLAAPILNELIHMALIEQAFSEEEEKSRRALEKERQKWLDEAFKEVKASLEKDEQKLLLPLGEQSWRNALLPYALRSAMEQHLQTTAAGQMLDAWLSERKRGASILYYQRLGHQPPLSPDPQECWLFKWWFLRQPAIKQQGESEHA